MNWIEQVIDATKETESPTRYYYWSALATISSVVKRNVYLNRGGQYTLYPNIYVLLIGPSGVRKGPPVTLARKLSEEVKTTRVLAGRGSIQAFIKELSTAYHMPSGGILTDACGFLVTGEIGTFLVEDPAAYTLLTDLYDSSFHNQWKNYIKGTGTDTLKNVYLTLLGASNEILLHDFIPKNVVGGGFIGRTMVIVEEKKRLVNSLIFNTNGNLDISKLAKHLYDLTKIEGPFRFTEQAATFADEWYKQFNEKQEKAKERDKLGLVERLFEHILKVSMLISLAKKTELVLELEDIQESIDACQECLPGTRRVFMGLGKSEVSGPIKIVLDELTKRPTHEISRSRLLSIGWGDFDSIVLDRVITTLTEANAIESFMGNDKKVWYRASKETLEKFKRITGG